MYLVFLNLSENNSLLTEQLNVRSFYDLSVLNKKLIEIQLTNFVGADINKVFLFDSEKEIKFSLFKLERIKANDILKKLFELSVTDKILLIRNDVYFESDVAEYEKHHIGDDFLAFTNDAGFCYGVLTSVGGLRRLLNKNITFNDLFTLSQKFADVQINLSGYIKALNTVNDYKNLLFDILNSKTKFKPPHIAEGIFTEGAVPENDFSIIPPVYLGDNVQIEGGSVIGPNTVVHNNSLISSDTSVKNSILLEEVYVSSNCYVNGAVCCKNSSIKRNSAVFGGSLIGENALIGEDMMVENDSIINKNVKFDRFIKSPFTEKVNDVFHNDFSCLSPDKAALLGLAIGKVFGKPKVLIADDGVPNSLSVKLALLSGLMASGAECLDIGIAFKSFVFFGASYCECAYSVFIGSQNGGTDIGIFNSENIPISKTDRCNLFDFCSKEQASFKEPTKIKPIRQVHGLKRMYIQEITSAFTDLIEKFPVIVCENEVVSKIIKEIQTKTAEQNSKNEKLYIKINESGTKVSITFDKKTYTEKNLKKLVRFYFPKVQNNGEHINNYFKKLWKKDCVFLVFTVIYIMENLKEDLSTLIGALPTFFIESKTFISDLKAGDFARKFNDFSNFSYRNNAHNIKLEKGLVRVLKGNNSNNIKVISASSDVSVSKEICDFVSSLFKAIDT